MRRPSSANLSGRSGGGAGGWDPATRRPGIGEGVGGGEGKSRTGPPSVGRGARAASSRAGTGGEGAGSGRPRPVSASSGPISQVLRATTTSSTGGVAIRDKLFPQEDIPSRFCVHCRGPHLKGAPLHEHYTVADRYYGLCIDVTALATHYRKGTLPAAKDNGATQAIRWTQAGAPDVGVDLATWLPVFIDGARESKEPLRMIAVHGAKAMMRLPSHRVLPLVPLLVPPLRR